MSDVVIKVENLGKKYRISHQAERHRYATLRDVIAEKAKGLFQKLKFGKEKTETENQSSNPDPISAFRFLLCPLPKTSVLRHLSSGL